MGRKQKLWSNQPCQGLRDTRKALVAQLATTTRAVGPASWPELAMPKEYNEANVNHFKAVPNDLVHFDAIV